MSSSKRITCASVAALAISSWTSSVTAEEPFVTSPAHGVAAIPLIDFPSYERLSVVSKSASVPRGPFGSKPIPAAALATKRGGDRVFNDAQLKGVVADNQAINVNTGMNVISDGAFAGSSGLSTVIQNSGNNVLIQNATIVNVQLK
jgi:hypothetical protein